MPPTFDFRRPGSAKPLWAGDTTLSPPGSAGECEICKDRIYRGDTYGIHYPRKFSRTARAASAAPESRRPTTAGLQVVSAQHSPTVHLPYGDVTIGAIFCSSTRTAIGPRSQYLRVMRPGSARRAETPVSSCVYQEDPGVSATTRSLSFPSSNLETQPLLTKVGARSEETLHHASTIGTAGHRSHANPNRHRSWDTPALQAAHASHGADDCRPCRCRLQLWLRPGRLLRYSSNGRYVSTPMHASTGLDLPFLD